MIQAAKLASAKRITAVIPWFPYSRQDKKSKPREPITARLVADMLQLAGVDRVLTMDLHAGQIQGFFTIPVDHMTALPLFAQYFRDLGLYGDGVVSVSPDAGPGEAWRAVRRDDRRRLRDPEQDAARRHEQAAVTEVIGTSRARSHRRATTSRPPAARSSRARRALREHGAREVWVYATHGLFNGAALERIAASRGHHRHRRHRHGPGRPVATPDNVKVLTVSGILAETILNVFADDSVSAIFAARTSSSSAASRAARRGRDAGDRTTWIGVEGSSEREGHGGEERDRAAAHGVSRRRRRRADSRTPGETTAPTRPAPSPQRRCRRSRSSSRRAPPPLACLPSPSGDAPRRSGHAAAP